MGSRKEEYDLAEAFRVIEDELIASMIRNLKRHRAEEEKEGIQWSQWQVKQLEALEVYKRQNQKKYKKKFQSLNKRIEELIRTAYETGGMEQEIEILEAIKNGFREYHHMDSSLQGEFMKLNGRKLEALIKAVTDDMEKAETAVLRMADDKYRKAIFNAQVYANAGAGTYEKAVDMAVKDMLAAGLNCVQYKNGARHTPSDYADMAIRTAAKRAYLQGEGEMRQEWGIHTVIMNKRQKPCPKCLRWAGKVLIDDVWSGGSARDGPYPLMSAAIDAGLYHPRCKDSHTTYFPGISTSPENTFTRKELEEIENSEREEAEKQYAGRQAEKFDRLARYSLDAENKKKYAERSRLWNIAASKRFETYDELSEYISQVYNGTINEDVRKLNIRQVSQTLTEFEKILDDFPYAANVFKGINTAEMGMAAVIPTGELVLNPKWYQSLNKKLIGTGYHEAGHLLELALIKKNNPNAHEDRIFSLWHEGSCAQEIVKKAYQRISTQKELGELRKDISAYSMKDYSETLAEAVRDYYTNDYGASLLSIQIIKVLREEMK